MLFVLGNLHPLKEYEYIGSHHTDSGLTAVLRDNVYSDEDVELDWLELVAKTLENPRDGAIDVDDFSPLDFCASAPEEESAVAVFGKRNPANEGYESVVMRAWCKAFPTVESDLEP
jgi:hypothetical protein